jgi:hypothetical protein
MMNRIKYALGWLFTQAVLLVVFVASKIRGKR